MAHGVNTRESGESRVSSSVPLCRRGELLGDQRVEFKNHDGTTSQQSAKERVLTPFPFSVDPQRYLTSVLAKIGQTPVDELEQFLPDVWKREDAAVPPEGDH